MRKRRRLYASTVESYRPCKEQYKLLRKYCGDKGYVTITERWCQSHASEFDWYWAARNLLNKPAREAYLAATASAWEAYLAARASAWEAYIAATASAREAYLAARAQAREAYFAARAQAWAAAYINDTGESDE